MPTGERFQNREWLLYYAQLDGAIMKLWKIPDAFAAFNAEITMADIDKLKAKTKPSFVNITDASVQWVGIYPKSKFLSTNYRINSCGLL